MYDVQDRFMSLNRAPGIDVHCMDIARAYTASRSSPRRWPLRSSRGALRSRLGQALAVRIPVAISARVYLAVLAIADRKILAEVREVLPRRSRRGV
jgi:hypothetical protein